jgi:hypothetical protein
VPKKKTKASVSSAQASTLTKNILLYIKTKITLGMRALNKQRSVPLRIFSLYVELGASEHAVQGSAVFFIFALGVCVNIDQAHDILAANKLHARPRLAIERQKVENLQNKQLIRLIKSVWLRVEPHMK